MKLRKKELDALAKECLQPDGAPRRLVCRPNPLAMMPGDAWRLENEAFAVVGYAPNHEAALEKASAAFRRAWDLHDALVA